jgi:peptide/nickel transport system substrate-binding protein
VILTLDNADPRCLFRMGENTAVILRPEERRRRRHQPVGTGPFTASTTGRRAAPSRWCAGTASATSASVQAAPRHLPLHQRPGGAGGGAAGRRHRRHAALRTRCRPCKQLQADKRFTVEIGSTSGKGILAINNRKRKPLDDVRVRRAIMHAIDRKAFIDGVLEGLGQADRQPLRAHRPGYVDLTGLYPYDPDKAKALLKEAGVTDAAEPDADAAAAAATPARAARWSPRMLAKVGINAKIENVEWAQWLSGPFKGNFDLTIINHVEPLDYVQYANPDYYWGYDSKAFRDLTAKFAATSNAKDRSRLFADIQKQVAADQVNAFVFNPAQVAVAKKGLKGLWSSSPIFANDLAAVSWQ